MMSARTYRTQNGIMLIECIIGLLIFLIGVLAMLGLQASAITVQSEAQYRIEASKQVDRLLGNINVGVDRSSPAALQTSLQQFQHQPTGTSCAFSGAASTQATVTNWIDAMTSSSSTTRLPGATAAMQQILVDTANFNRVTVTVCWQEPQSPKARQYSVISYIN